MTINNTNLNNSFSKISSLAFHSFHLPEMGLLNVKLIPKANQIRSKIWFPPTTRNLWRLMTRDLWPRKYCEAWRSIVCSDQTKVQRAFYTWRIKRSSAAWCLSSNRLNRTVVIHTKKSRRPRCRIKTSQSFCLRKAICLGRRWY